MHISAKGWIGYIIKKHIETYIKYTKIIHKIHSCKKHNYQQANCTPANEEWKYKQFGLKARIYL